MPKVIKITSKMLYKLHITEIIVLGYLQRVAMLKVLIITMLEMTMLSLLPEVPTTIGSRLWVACKKLSTRWNICMKKHTNFYVWSDGMGSQFRSRYIFKLLASKDPMDGIRGTVKNVILRKVKSSQLVIHSLLKVSEAVKNLFCQFALFTYLNTKILLSQKV